MWYNTPAASGKDLLFEVGILLFLLPVWILKITYSAQEMGILTSLSWLWAFVHFSTQFIGFMFELFQ